VLVSYSPPRATGSGRLPQCSLHSPGGGLSGNSERYAASLADDMKGPAENSYRSSARSITQRNIHRRILLPSFLRQQWLSRMPFSLDTLTSRVIGVVSPRSCTYRESTRWRPCAEPFASRGAVNRSGENCRGLPG
jgi:hypothetical protein